MLKDKIVIVDVSKKTKIVSEVSSAITQESFYEKVKLVGQGTFGKVYLVRILSSRLKDAKMAEIMPSRKCSRIVDTKIGS
jgi:ABC-type phosphate/phosphonate transport system ATPase subunit